MTTTEGRRNLSSTTGSFRRKIPVIRTTTERRRTENARERRKEGVGQSVPLSLRIGYRQVCWRGFGRRLPGKIQRYLLENLAPRVLG
jgi:hypothetical protein